jgi:hypothetical protein
MLLSCCRNLGIFGVLVFMLWIFYHTCQIFTSLLMLISFRCLTCSHYFCTDGWGPCVVRGPVDGCFLVWWVIDNVVWTDSLAKYCRCRLRLDWCWCMWRTSAKGCRQWGLHVWRRQVGFVRGTRWPAGSSAGRMVAWTARWNRGQLLGWASKLRSSRDYVGAESWVEIGGGYTEFTGFPVVYQKTTGFLGWSTKPRPKNRRRCYSSAIPVWPVGLTGLTGGYRSDRCATT